jgi:DUF1680 family protein
MLELLVAVAFSLDSVQSPEQEPTPASLRAVPFHAVRITDSFWSPRIETNRRVTVDACLDRCEETGRIRNLRIAGGLEEGKHEGYLFNDSDVYKVIEGAAYTLHGEPDDELRARVEAVIDAIAKAQREDGYINSYYTLVEPTKRWQNIEHGHELYCAGHLIEAGIAWSHATGDRRLLDIAIAFADHIASQFGPTARLDPPGHPELELALVKLADETGDRRWFDLAKFFLDQRGSPARTTRYGEYSQDHLPLIEQREIVGHAVRAMYLCCGMADVVRERGDADLRRALFSLWESVSVGKTYVTGGIGSRASNEGFTAPFDLPNESAYSETCAAIGMALWTHRMFLLTGDKHFADILERVLYNAMLSGVSLSGDRFFYTNPLASNGSHQRKPWYACACCPSNIVRFLPAIGERVLAYRGDTLVVVLYVGHRANVPLAGGPVEVAMSTRYPWDGAVSLRIEPKTPRAVSLRLRKPPFVSEPVRFLVGEREVEAREVDGFYEIERTWSAGDELRFELPLSVRRATSDPRVQANRGRVALMRGPLVYCVEGIDVEGEWNTLALDGDALLEPKWRADLLGGVMTLEGRGFRAIPYFAWANRGETPMAVWIEAR